MTEGIDPISGEQYITEGIQSISMEQINAAIDERAVKMFRARVHAIYPDGSVDLLREHNELPDGTLVPDGAPTVAVNLALKLDSGDVVYCFQSGGNTFVWGKVYIKATPPAASDQTVEELKTELLATIEALDTKLTNKIDATDTTFNNFRDNAIGPGGEGGWRDDLQKAIGNKLGAEVFETFRENHVGGESDISKKNSTHGKLEEAVAGKAPRQHGPHIGNHDDSHHKVNFLVKSDVKTSALTASGRKSK